jgi:SAM-dependent methyltransferase
VPADLHVGPGQDAILDDLAARSRNYNAWLLRRARPHLGRRVLDAGAGIGTFTRLLAEQGLEVTAAEPHPPYADRLREDLAAFPNVDVVAAEAAALPDDVANFDSVLCLNVLEHIADDEDALRSFRERLAPAGRLLLLVPAHAALYGATDVAVAHERRYAKGSLRRLLAGVGFDVVDLRYVNPVGALGWLASSRVLRRTELSPRALGAFDALVPLLSRLDRVDVGFGLSLWAVARRR